VKFFTHMLFLLLRHTCWTAAGKDTASSIQGQTTKEREHGRQGRYHRELFQARAFVIYALMMASASTSVITDDGRSDNQPSSITGFLRGSL